MKKISHETKSSEIFQSINQSIYFVSNRYIFINIKYTYIKQNHTKCHDLGISPRAPVGAEFGLTPKTLIINSSQAVYQCLGVFVCACM